MQYDQIQFCQTATLPSRVVHEEPEPASMPTVLVDIEEFMPESETPTALPAPPRVPRINSMFEPRLPESSIPHTWTAPSTPPTLREGTGRHLYLVRSTQPSGPPSVPPTAPARRLHAQFFRAA